MRGSHQPLILIFSPKRKSLSRKPKTYSHYQIVMRHTNKLFILLICLLPFTWGSYSSAQELPDIGDSSARSLSPQQEREIGEAFMQALRQTSTLSHDPLINDYIESLGYRLVVAAAPRNTDFHFYTLIDPSINAFAVVGGYIVVHSGLILASENESELAAVMGHEIAHITQRHVARMIEQVMQMTLPSIAAIAAAIALGSQGQGDASMALMTAMSGGMIQKTLNFSRSNEREADRVGIETLYQADLDPNGVPVFFERLQKATRFYGQPLEFLSTHPVTQERIADSRNRAEQYPIKPYRNNPYFYLMQARTFIEQNDPQYSLDYYENALKEDKNHPPKEALQYGYAMALLKNNQLDAARQQLSGLLEAQPNQIPFIITQTDIEQAAGKSKEALSILEGALVLNPGNHALSMQYARIALAADKYKESEAILAQQVRQRPSDPVGYQLLSQVQARLGDECRAYQSRGEVYYLNGNLPMATRQFKRALNACQQAENAYQTAIVEARIEKLENQQSQGKKKRR